VKALEQVMCRKLRTIRDNVNKNSPKAGSLAFFILKEFDDRDHCRILIATVNKLVTQRTERQSTHEVCL